MAFALKSFLATGYELCGPQPQRQTQKLMFGITGLVTDVALDVGDLSGTFWTNALADAVYGTMAASVKEWITTNHPIWAAPSNVLVVELFPRVQAAVASGAAFTRSLNATTKLPQYVFAASNGLTVATLFVELELVNNVSLNSISYNPEGA